MGQFLLHLLTTTSQSSILLGQQQRSQQPSDMNYRFCRHPTYQRSLLAVQWAAAARLQAPTGAWACGGDPQHQKSTVRIGHAEHQSPGRICSGDVAIYFANWSRWHRSQGSKTLRGGPVFRGTVSGARCTGAQIAAAGL